MTTTRTVRSLIAAASEQLAESSSSARLDAELLLAHQLGWERTKVITEPHFELEASDIREFWELISRRASYEPVAYILGRVDFWKSDFLVTPDVLIPRPETEHLVEFGLERVKGKRSPRILDLGTGSGCVIISLIQELRLNGIEATGVAVDQSTAALDVARKNAESLDVAEYLDFYHSDWFSDLPPEQFHCIVSNPPYIAQGDTEISPDITFEPDMALYAEGDGLAHIQLIIRESPSFLHSSASLLIETGYKQHAEIDQFLKQESFVRKQYQDYLFHRDLAGLDRVVELIRK